jgi:intracellular sulfur oxidation DsrE/DsrF family protein
VLFLHLLPIGVFSEDISTGVATSSSYIAQIEAHTTVELSSILSRVDMLLQDEQGYASRSPVAVILHGTEIQAFLKDNYQQNQALVNLAARLDAYNAVDIQVCETWMSLNSVDESQLPPFISTVPYGPAAEANLVNEGYEYF